MCWRSTCCARRPSGSGRTSARWTWAPAQVRPRHADALRAQSPRQRPSEQALRCCVRVCGTCCRARARSDPYSSSGAALRRLSDCAPGPCILGPRAMREQSRAVCWDCNPKARVSRLPERGATNGGTTRLWTARPRQRWSWLPPSVWLLRTCARAGAPGAGVVAIALALAGADVVAADLPRVTPLTRANAAANCRSPPHRIQVGPGRCIRGTLPPVVAGFSRAGSLLHRPAGRLHAGGSHAGHCANFARARACGARCGPPRAGSRRSARPASNPHALPGAAADSTRGDPVNPRQPCTPRLSTTRGAAPWPRWARGRTSSRARTSCTRSAASPAWWPRCARWPRRTRWWCLPFACGVRPPACVGEG